MIEQLATELHRRRFTFVDEAELQGAIEEVLKELGLPFVRELRLSAKDRVDFLVGDAAVEVKTKGSSADVVQQLWRYAKSADVASLVLVTSVARHRAMPIAVLGKPVSVIYLSQL